MEKRIFKWDGGMKVKERNGKKTILGKKMKDFKRIQFVKNEQ